MSQDLIRSIEKEYMKASVPELFPGDTVKVAVKIIEGKKERIQNYEGVVIRVTGSGTSRTVTVRRVFQGIGVERVFLLHSPKVDSIKVMRRGDVRRARLYYMRGRSGKAARIREKLGAVLNKEVVTVAEAPTPAVSDDVAQPADQQQQPAPEAVEAPVEQAPAAEETTEG